MLSLQILFISCNKYINPFVSHAHFLYTLKTSENLKVFWRFQGVEKGCIGNKWVNFSMNSKYTNMYHFYTHRFMGYKLRP